MTRLIPVVVMSHKETKFRHRPEGQKEKREDLSESESESDRIEEVGDDDPSLGEEV